MKRGFVILYIICISLLCGCNGGIYTNYKEVEQLQLVRTLGIDQENENEVRLTVSSGKSGGGPGALLSTTAPSVTAAARKLNDFAAGKQLFYDHSKFILFGEDTLRQDIGEFLSSVERSTEMRTSIELFAVRGDSARSLMIGSGDESYDISNVMESVQRDLKLRGDIQAFTVAETQRALSERGAALICALRPADTADVVYSVDAGTTAVADGFGILIAGQLAGYLNEKQATAACLMMNTPGLSAISLRGDDGSAATVMLEGGKFRLRPQWSTAGLDAVAVEVEVNAALQELSAGRQSGGSDALPELETLLEQELKGRCEQVLKASRTLGADFLGFGQHLRAQDAGRFDRLDSDWPGSTEFTVTVRATMDRSGGLDDAVGNEGGGTLDVPG